MIFFQATAGKKIKFTLGKNHSKNFKIKLQNIRNQVQIDRGLDYSTVCIYFKLTVSILIGQNVVRHVVLEHKLGRSRLMHKMMAKPVTKMTWREFAEWKNAKVRCRKFGIYFHLRTEHVNILKCHSHNVYPEENRTKHSSIILLRLARFSAGQTLIFVLLWLTFISLKSIVTL